MAKKEVTYEDEIIKTLIENNTDMHTSLDVNNVLDSLHSKLIQALLNGEMDYHLGYTKSSHEQKNSSNRRNGSSGVKKVRTNKGEILINMPRDRDGSFDPVIVRKRQRVLDNYDDIVTGMYAKGLSLEDIKDMILKIYKIELSKEFLSSLISRVNDEITSWQNRALQKMYAFVYIDCLWVHIKGEVVSEKRAIYVMIGIGLDGKKEVIGIWIDDTESATFWTNILNEVKSRGTEDILFISMDGLTGLKEAIERVYPKTITQRCIVHLVRNLYDLCPKKRAKEIISDFKKIYTSSNYEQAELEYNNFVLKYKEDVKIVNKVSTYMEYIYQLMEYPSEIRKIIYTTNAIESVNSCLRKVTRGKGSFPNKESCIKVLYLRIRDLEKKWSKGTKNWVTILNQLVSIYGERVTKYLNI